MSHTDFGRVDDSACLKLLNRKIVLGISEKTLQKSGLAVSESTNAEN